MGTILFCYAVTGLYIACVSIIKMYRSRSAAVKQELNFVRQYSTFAHITGIMVTGIFITVAWPYFIVKAM